MGKYVGKVGEFISANFFQIIDAIGVELKCDHLNCEFSARRGELEEHEKSCQHRDPIQ